MELSIRLPPEGRDTCKQLSLPPHFFKREDINNMKKSYNIVAFLLSFLLCLGLAPVNAFADETSTETWPKLTALKLTEKANLSAFRNPTNDRTIKSVTYENYNELKQLDPYNGFAYYSAGKIILHVEEVLAPNFQYSLDKNSLDATFTDIPETMVDGRSSFQKAVTFSIGATTAKSNLFAYTTNPKARYVYEMEVVVDEQTPAWPKLTALKLTEKANLSAFRNPTNDRTIKSVTYENYNELKQLDPYNGFAYYSAGKIILHVEEVLAPNFQYSLDKNSLDATFTDIPETMVDGRSSFQKAVTFSIGATTAKSNLFAYTTNPKARYVYEMEVVVDEQTPAWPKLTALKLTEKANLSAFRNPTNDRTIKSVTYENYNELKQLDPYNGFAYYSAGKIILHVEEVLAPNFQYSLDKNSLDATFTDIPETMVDGRSSFQKAVTFSIGATTAKSNLFAYTTDPKARYVYEMEVVVDESEPKFDYPALKSVGLGNAPQLTSSKDAVPIIAVSHVNYDTAESSNGRMIAGKVTLYVSRALSAAQTYTVSDVTAEYTVRDGYVMNNRTAIVGTFAGGTTETTGAYYAHKDNTMYSYTLAVEVGYPDDGVYVFDGTGTRIAPTKARVSFNANQAGTYHYAVVAAAAAAPTMPTDAGAAMTAGENTFVIDGLAEGAKKVYIWGKNGEKVSARPVVVEIDAEAKSYSLTFNTTTAATDGILRITADGKDVSFKTRIMVTPTTEAKGIYEGQRITVWMGNPYTDKDLNGVTLNPAVDVTIAEDKNSFSFTMPAANVYGASSDWRTYVDSTKTRYTLTGIASTFDQTNVSGIKMGHVVFKDEGGNIITQATSGTTVTATPVPSTTANYTLEFQFTEWSDAIGFTLAVADKTKKTLTFTVGSENISLKANFKPVGTKVTWGTNITSADANAPQVSMPGNVSSPFVFKPQPTFASIDGKAWYDRYEFEGWVITRDDKTLTGDDVNTSQAVGTLGTPGYWTYAKFDISGKEMTVTANFRERKFASVTAVADATMGSATVSVNGSEAATSKLAFEDQTVTLTATPKSQRYMLKGWDVKDTDNTAVEYRVAADANVATFIMPDTGKDITATAIFEVDTSKPNDDCSLERVELWSADGAKLLSASNRAGDTYTIELPASVALSELPNLHLKFICGDAEHAVVKQGDTVWDESKGCGITTLGQTQVFTVVAEDKQTSAPYKVVINAETKITAVTLLNGTETIASGTLSGSKWTITLPDSIDADLLTQIGASDTIFMKIEYAGASLKQVATTNGAGYDDAGKENSWDSGKIMCAISPGSEAQFIVTGIDGLTKEYTIAITRPNVSTTPVLEKVSVERTSDNAATVKFTSSMAGNYFYKVVVKGAAAPTVDTTRGGTTAVKGENTITLTNLSTGARDIYIVVKSLSNVECDPFKIEIPAYGSTETPDEGDFTITVNAPPTGGTITPNRTRANEGDEIIVTVTPKTGYQMKAGSLRYAFSAPGAKYKTITGNSFKMPGGDVSITCDWETASTTVNGITAFSINGVAGAVNNSTNTITITMPRGTDVTKLTPVIATNGVKSLTPGNGVTVDFTNAVTYTAAMEDGSSKTYTVTVYVDKGTLADQFWDKLTDFATQVPWWQYAEKQQSTSKYPKYW